MEMQRTISGNQIEEANAACWFRCGRIGTGRINQAPYVGDPQAGTDAQFDFLPGRHALHLLARVHKKTCKNTVQQVVTCDPVAKRELFIRNYT
jgi:hypothetical protein